MRQYVLLIIIWLHFHVRKKCEKPDNYGGLYGYEPLLSGRGSRRDFMPMVKFHGGIFSRETFTPLPVDDIRTGRCFTAPSKEDRFHKNEIICQLICQ
jgi:hypothetical protein